MQLLYLTQSAGIAHGRQPYHRNLKASKGDKQRHETSHSFTIFASCTCAKTPNNPGALALASQVPYLLPRFPCYYNEKYCFKMFALCYCRMRCRSLPELRAEIFFMEESMVLQGDWFSLRRYISKFGYYSHQQSCTT